MLHKTVEVKATTTTDAGEFTAIAAAYTVDRGNERILPGAFSASIESWQAQGKMIPLHWDHGGDPADIIGTVDPASMKETDAGLMVAGRLDLENSSMAREAWRAIKSGSMSLSFGYMVTDGEEAKDGTYELKTVDLFEITVTPAPMNPDTRFLSLKSASVMSRDEISEELALLRKRVDELAEQVSEDVQPPPVEDAPEQAEQSEPLQASDVDPFEIALLEAALPTRRSI